MTFSLQVFSEGFFLGASLIMAIGAQNLFVIRQSITGKYVLTVVLVSSLCDFLMIAFGTLGLGSFIASYGLLQKVMVVLGILFLLYFAAKSAFNIWHGRSVERLQRGSKEKLSQKQVILAGLGFSLLNPHAVLDTVVVMGSVSGGFEEFNDRLQFALGAGLASIIWFFFLAYSAFLLGPIFLKKRVAVALDLFVAFLMSYIAIDLVFTEFVNGR